MTSQTMQTIVGTPTLPRVNLLPPEIAEARALRQYRLAAGGAVLVVALGVAGFYWHSRGAVADAQTSLDESKAQQVKLNAQALALRSVTDLKTQVAAAQQTLTSAMSSEILWSHVLQDMSVSLPVNAWMTNMVMSSGAPTTAAGTPFANTTAVGNITMVGKAVTHNDVAKLLGALDNEKGLSDAAFTSSAKDSTAINGLNPVIFTVTAAVNQRGVPVHPVATPKPITPTTPAGH